MHFVGTGIRIPKIIQQQKMISSYKKGMGGVDKLDSLLLKDTDKAGEVVLAFGGI